MKKTYLPAFALALSGVFCFDNAAFAQLQTLRIVTWNIEADIDGVTTPRPGLTNGDIEGIGEEVLADGVYRPLDIIALEETTGNTTTIAPIVTNLNLYYNTTAYAQSSFQATESGGDTADGNGPNGIIYNTNTVQLLASVGVLPPNGAGALGSSSGEYREVVRYEFAPANLTPTAANEFYIYVSHYKSGTSSGDATDRAEEAVIIRNDASNNLPANARIIYTGDYNVETSGDAQYQDIVRPGKNAGIDPLLPYGATNSGTYSITFETSLDMSWKTESSTSLKYRDDLQVVSSNVFNSYPGGLAILTNTYHAFGNNGTTGFGGNVNTGGNTSLNDLYAGAPYSSSTLLSDLTTASDHLPMVADYTIPNMPPPTAGFTVSPATGANPLSVNFTDTSIGFVTNWSWNFGDGATLSGTTANPTHIYAAPGTYNVTEIITGPDGFGTNIENGAVTVVTPYQAWQLLYFGCTNCPQAQTNADADGTGQDNLFKYVAGLNPTNPASVFTLTIAEVPNEPDWENISYGPAVAGRVYTPQGISDLINGAWTDLTTANPTATNGSVVTLTDTNAVLPQEFYRIEISGP